MSDPFFRNLLIAFCLFLGINFNGKSQEKWSLERCVTQALNSNLQIARSQLSIESAQINSKLSKTARYPNLNASSNLFWNFGRTIDPTSNEFITETFFSNNYGLNSGIIIFEGFRIRNNIAKSIHDLSASEAELAQIKDDISLQVCIAYLNVLFAKENITIAEKQLALNEQQLQRSKKLIAAGALAPAEILNIEAQIAVNEQNIIVAENNIEITLLRLKQLMQVDPSIDIDLVIPQEVSMAIDPDLMKAEEIMNAALKNRHDLKAMELRKLSAEKDIAIAKAGQYPRLTLAGSLSSNYSNQALEIIGFENQLFSQNVFINGSAVMIEQEREIPLTQKPSFGNQLENFLSYGFGFGLSIPIYNNGINQANVQRAELAVKDRILAKDEMVANLRNTITLALADAKAAKRKYSASQKAIEAQKENLENTTKRLEVGAANSFEWETIKIQLENAELTNIIDKYDYIFKVKVLEFYLGNPIKI